MLARTWSSIVADTVPIVRTIRTLETDEFGASDHAWRLQAGLGDLGNRNVAFPGAPARRRDHGEPEKLRFFADGRPSHDQCRSALLREPVGVGDGTRTIAPTCDTSKALEGFFVLWARPFGESDERVILLGALGGGARLGR